jgi:hypothetical protein
MNNTVVTIVVIGGLGLAAYLVWSHYQNNSQTGTLNLNSVAGTAGGLISDLGGLFGGSSDDSES